MSKQPSRKPPAGRETRLKRRSAARDFIAHFALFAFILTLVCFVSYALFEAFGVGKAGLTIRACAAFSVAFWLYWALRAFIHLNSQRVYNNLGFDQGTFLFFLFAVFALCALSEFLQYGPVTPLAVMAAVFLCLCRMAYSHMENMDGTLDIAEAFSVQPVREIRRHNNKMLAVFVVLAAILSVTVYFSLSGGVLNGWLERLGSAVMNFIRSLFGNIPPPEEQIQPETAVTEPQEMGGMFMSEPSVFMQVLGWIVRHYYAALAVVGVVAFTYVFISQLKGFRFKRGARVYDNGDVSEAIKPESGENLFRRFWQGNAPADPVRRAFYKKLRKHRDLIAKSDTAKEMAGKIAEREDIVELAEEYDKVRYGEKK